MGNREIKAVTKVKKNNTGQRRINKTEKRRNYSMIRERSYKENSCGIGMKQQWSSNKIDRNGKKEIGNTSAMKA